MKSAKGIIGIGGLVGLSAYVGIQLQGAPPVVLMALMGIVVLSVYVAGELK